MSRLIVVSNRVALPEHGAPPPGGLAVGVLAALRQSGEGIWLGWSGATHPEGAKSAEPRRQEQDGICFVTVDLPEESFTAFYDGFCNGTLWPLHHYFTEAFRYDQQEYQAYRRINLCFAQAVLKEWRPGDKVWIHDYQLMPLGRMLRELGVTGPIGFFLHIPFPQTAVLKLLPPHEELVRDLCRYDLLGFQTAEDLQAFRAAVPKDAAAPQLGVFPIGVDAPLIAQQAADAERLDDQVKRLAGSLLGRQLLIGVDRLDYSKGLVERFTAYQTLLELNPELQGNVTFIQIAPLSRINVAAYASIRDTLEQTAGHINGKFADADWTPIRYLNKDFSHQTLSGFLRMADVGVVTPVRDGMNLVAKEFVAAQDPDCPGVLVLSNLAGAARELADGALLVNPYDNASVAAAVKQALTMPLNERRARYHDMWAVLGRNSIGHWHESFLACLQTAAGGKAASTTAEPRHTERLYNA